jgi:hypothetical protein
LVLTRKFKSISGSLPPSPSQGRLLTSLPDNKDVRLLYTTLKRRHPISTQSQYFLRQVIFRVWRHQHPNRTNGRLFRYSQNSCQHRGSKAKPSDIPHGISSHLRTTPIALSWVRTPPRACRHRTQFHTAILGLHNVTMGLDTAIPAVCLPSDSGPQPGHGV